MSSSRKKKQPSSPAPEIQMMHRFNLDERNTLHVDGVFAGVDAVVSVRVSTDGDAIHVFRRRSDMGKVVFFTVEG